MIKARKELSTMKEGYCTEIFFRGKVTKIPIKKPVHVSQFEYDYLMAQEEVDTQKWHMSRMIEKGYFKGLAPYAVVEVTDHGEVWTYVLIGVIRDLLCADAFVIDGKEAGA